LSSIVASPVEGVDDSLMFLAGSVLLFREAMMHNKVMAEMGIRK